MAINDQLSTGYYTNPLIIEHLKALQSARESFMKAESSAKLINALRKQTWHTKEHFDLGQAVYYKRNNYIKWKVPGKIVGQDGSVVFIRHGDFYITVHCSRIQIADSLPDTIPQYNDSQLLSQALSQQTDELNKTTRCASSDDYVGSNSRDEQYSNLTNRFSNISLEDLFQNLENLKFKKGQLVTFNLDKVPYIVKILGRAGKATGQYKNYFNVEYQEPYKYLHKQASVNFDKTGNLKLLDSTEEIFQVEDECF